MFSKKAISAFVERVMRTREEQERLHQQSAAVADGVEHEKL